MAVAADVAIAASHSIDDAAVAAAAARAPTPLHAHARSAPQRDAQVQAAPHMVAHSVRAAPTMQHASVAARVRHADAAVWVAPRMADAAQQTEHEMGAAELGGVGDARDVLDIASETAVEAVAAAGATETACAAAPAATPAVCDAMAVTIDASAAAAISAEEWAFAAAVQHEHLLLAALASVHPRVRSLAARVLRQPSAVPAPALAFAVRAALRSPPAARLDPSDAASTIAGIDIDVAGSTDAEAAGACVEGSVLNVAALQLLQAAAARDDAIASTPHVDAVDCALLALRALHAPCSSEPAPLAQCRTSAAQCYARTSAACCAARGWAAAGIALSAALCPEVTEAVVRARQVRASTAARRAPCAARRAHCRASAGGTARAGSAGSCSLHCWPRSLGRRHRACRARRFHGAHLRCPASCAAGGAAARLGARSAGVWRSLLPFAAALPAIRCCRCGRVHAPAVSLGRRSHSGGSFSAGCLHGCESYDGRQVDGAGAAASR